MPVDYYEILEVAPGASTEQIRAAITAQRRVWVRRQSSPDPERRAYAEQRVRDVDAAEKALLDPAARSAYDEKLARTRQAAATAGSGAAAGGQGNGPNGGGLRDRVPAPAPAPGGSRGPGTPGGAGSGGPGTSGHRRDPDLHDHLRRGDRYLEQGRWRLAQAEYDYVREREPGNLRALTGLGAAQVGSGRVKEGLAVLQRAVEANPDAEDVKVALATALYEVAVTSVDHWGDGRGTDRPVITSRRQYTLVRRHLRRIRKLDLTDWNVRMYAEELKDLLAEARAPVWVRSRSLRLYLVPLAGAILFVALAHVESLRVVGACWIVLIVALYVVRHRQPAWKQHRRGYGRGRGGGRGPTHGGTFRKGI
ncbi:J domain-containing protein [Actinopolymorpha singaporensis]|uniref:Tetratricopeptide repeat-containing protein n=1 Tax=Actinopolymorpha singaporensis TaxID=117157 RepID=A0A1H1VGY5_9ACTN|nr:tetratricopeptide repeat protein [Actinopolymorpha singaporensis]SDS83349.1 Tetratricopeptide repeat-containing protein [Actinopolymorpha singaporensis]